MIPRIRKMGPIRFSLFMKYALTAMIIIDKKINDEIALIKLSRLFDFFFMNNIMWKGI